MTKLNEHPIIYLWSYIYIYKRKKGGGNRGHTVDSGYEWPG